MDHTVAQSDSLTSLVAVVLLLAANAFFVGAEFALVKVRGFRTQQLADEGSRAARLTLRIQEDLEAYLAACQLGITMASLGLGWVGEPAVAVLLKPALESFGMSDQALHTVSFLVGFFIFSSLHIVVGEQVPKTLAIRKPEPVSLWAAYPLRWFFVASYPLTWLLNRAARWMLALLGVAESSGEEVLSSAELRDLINVSTTHGELDSKHAAMFHNLFQFDDRPVERIMVPRREVDYLDLRAPHEDNAQRIFDTLHSRLPLVDGDWENVVGVVLVKEVLSAMVQGGDPLADLPSLAREPLMIPESQRVAKLFEFMRVDRAHMAFVLDEYGEFVGLVTLEDLVEEIVGEIADELDVDASRFDIMAVDGGWEAHGLAPLADVERVTGFSPGPIDANTLSGFFMQRLERMPRVGDECTESGFALRVTEVRQRHVRRCTLRPEAAPEERADPQSPPAPSPPAAGPDAPS